MSTAPENLSSEAAPEPIPEVPLNGGEALDRQAPNAPAYPEVALPSPSDALTLALQQYCEELEALHSSMGHVSGLLALMARDGQKEQDEFINKHGKNVRREGPEVIFNLALEQRAAYSAIERKLKNAQSALRLIPRNFIVALVCAYDSLLGKVVRFILESKPAILDDSERTLKVSELFNFSSLEAAREFLIEKEVETVLRRSHTDQFKWLETKLGTPFNKGLKSWPTFVELTERRNLFVHCDGVVSSQYLSMCKLHKCKSEPNLALGTRLPVTKSYFEEAYRCLYEVGIKLAHVIWRKLYKAEYGKIDANLNEVSLNLIQKGEYEVAIRVLEFFTEPHMTHSNEMARLVMIVNLAQAHKWKGDTDACKRTLASVDWSASEERFRLAVATLHDEFPAAFRHMRRLKHEDQFHKVYYKEWPVFRELRKHPDFPSVYQECYGEQFIIEQTVPSPIASGSDDVPDLKDIFESALVPDL